MLVGVLSSALQVSVYVHRFRVHSSSPNPTTDHKIDSLVQDILGRARMRAPRLDGAVPICVPLLLSYIYSLVTGPLVTAEPL